MADDGWPQGLVLLSCLIGAGLLSSFETALVGVPETRVRQAIGSGVRGANRLLYWIQAQDRILTTLSLLRLALVLGAGVAAVQWVAPVPLSPALVLALAVVALLGLVLSHLLPRVVAKRYAFAWARHSIWVVRVLVWMLFPVVAPLDWMAHAVSRALGGGPGKEEEAGAFWTADELGQLAVNAQTEVLEKPSEALLNSIIEFQDTVIKEIMVPRTEMVALSVGSTPQEVRTTVISAGHSRVPVYDDTIDNIVGVLHVKDLFARLLTQEGTPQENVGHAMALGKVLRPVFYVPEMMKISELLRDFQKRKTHMAIVVDEYGGTAGVVTLEDIIEEIVGEIQDEYDVEEKQFRIVSEDKLIADGRVTLWELQEPLGVTFPDEGGYETLAGFLMYLTGSLPEVGTVIPWQKLRFTIKEANEKRIDRVEVERQSGGVWR